MVPSHFKHICKLKGYRVQPASTNIRVDFGNLKNSKGLYKVIGHDSFCAWLTPEEAEKLNNTI